MKKEQIKILIVLTFISTSYFLYLYVNKNNLHKNKKATKAFIYSGCFSDGSTALYRYLVNDTMHYGSISIHTNSKEHVGDSIAIYYNVLNPDISLPQIDLNNRLVDAN